MKINTVVSILFITIFFTSCGKDVSYDVEMQKKDGVYNPSFGDYPLPGVWTEYEIDDTSEPIVNPLGIYFKYKFDTNGTIAINVSIIDQWIPLGEYEVDITETQITYYEGNTSIQKRLEYLEDRGDENLSCVRIAKYTIKDQNTSFDDNYQLCKE